MCAHYEYQSKSNSLFFLLSKVRPDFGLPSLKKQRTVTMTDFISKCVKFGMNYVTDGCRALNGSFQVLCKISACEGTGEVSFTPHREVLSGSRWCTRQSAARISDKRVLFIN